MQILNDLPSTPHKRPCDLHRVPASPNVCSGSYRCHAEHDWRTDTPPTPCSRTVGGAHPLCPDIPRANEMLTVNNAHQQTLLP